MIRMGRPLESPRILQSDGEQETRENCESYDLHPDDYRSATEKFKFDGDINGHESVKNALLQAQHNKCCYCESKFGATSYGAVEHFRPKGALQQGQGWNREYPGYYWLAYSWNNLLVSCERCNTSHKRFLFPLANPGLRARCHHDDLDAEDPLFVDPAREDPRRHVRFRGSAVEPLTERGRETVRGLGLRRNDLEEARREWLDYLNVLRCIVESEDKLERNKVECARRQLDAAVLSEGKYSAMARDFLEPNGDPGDSRGAEETDRPERRWSQSRARGRHRCRPPRGRQALLRARRRRRIC